MGWAQHYIAKLQAGEVVSFRPRGSSMEPKIKSGELCTVIPVRGFGAPSIGKGDIVLCKVNGRQYLHLVMSTGTLSGDIENDYYLIGNNRGHQNGWILGRHIYGKLIKVEP